MRSQCWIGQSNSYIEPRSLFDIAQHCYMHIRVHAHTHIRMHVFQETLFLDFLLMAFSQSEIQEAGSWEEGAHIMGCRRKGL